MFGARCTKYQLEPAPAPSVDDHAIERQPVRAGEGHGLGAGADDAGAHDLVGGLGRLAGAARTEMLDGLAHRREHRAARVRTPRRSPPAMMASVPFCAPSTPPLTGASRNCTPRAARNCSRPARGVGADGGAVDDERVLRAGPAPGLRRRRARPHRRRRRSRPRRARRRSRRAMAGDWQPSSAASAAALSRAAIPDGCEQAGLVEIFRHGSTHGTETCKADAHHRRELSGASATKENAVQGTAFIEH